jgi:hypothetical protein
MSGLIPESSVKLISEVTKIEISGRMIRWNPYTQRWGFVSGVRVSTLFGKIKPIVEWRTSR